MIEINEEIIVAAPPDQVWKVVSDPAEVVSCIRGAELGESHADGSFDGALVVKFSAVRVRFGARITLDLDEPERHGTMSARGRDGQGATRYTAHADFHVLTEPGSDRTRVTVRGEVTLAGKLASLIEAGAGAVVGRMSKDFADELTRRCTGEVTAPAPEAPGTGPAAESKVQPLASSLWVRVRAWWRRIVRRQTNGVTSGKAE